MRLLFVCEWMVASGGLLRLERVGRVLARAGHECAYVVFPSRKPPEFRSQFKTLTLRQARKSHWDAVLIPGADFTDKNIRSFARLRSPQFGLRVQMVLSDQHKRSRFLQVNAALDPDIVVFNNEHWPPGSFRDFNGKQFRHLIGAVDTNRFAFRPRRGAEGIPDRFVIGAQISKNPGPLIEAMEHLPADCVLRFFGFDRGGRFAAMASRLGSRVEYVGPKFDADLAAYYRGLDAMASAEEHAGWANVVAEAMASGVPTVTTSAGTLSIAKHQETALVVAEPTATEFAEKLLRLKNNPSVAAGIAANARSLIERFDWEPYSQALARLIIDVRSG